MASAQDRKRKSIADLGSADSSTKKVKLLDDSDASENEVDFKVNEEYAKRFQHNKERAEKHRRKFKAHSTWSA
jgi:protein KRI1